MYTEENEFDYNDYSENNNYSNKKSNVGLILKIALIIVLLILVIFVVFKIKNNNSNNNDNIKDNSENALLVFNNNMEILKSAGETYFFKEGNIPLEDGDLVNVTVNELIDNKLLTEVKDYDGNQCGYNTSYLSMIKNDDTYELKVKLFCPYKEDSVTYYYDQEYNCLNPNGEDYTIDDSKQEENDDNQDNNDSQGDTIGDTKEEFVCGVFSDWTTEYIADDTKEREERIVVIGYKENITYGAWSTPTTTPITPSDSLLVKTEEREEEVEIKTPWSSETTTKPEEKEGREIVSREVKEPYKAKVKVSGGTYTKILPSRDTNAKSCRVIKIGEVECTYESSSSYEYVTKYKTVTYYKYQDTIKTLATNVYYSASEITVEEPSYTDYILESEMPDGYKKLEGSELTQYRYKEKCMK